jgi:hypothetical protein
MTKGNNNFENVMISRAGLDWLIAITLENHERADVELTKKHLQGKCKLNSNMQAHYHL